MFARNDRASRRPFPGARTYVSSVDPDRGPVYEILASGSGERPPHGHKTAVWSIFLINSRKQIPGINGETRRARASEKRKVPRHPILFFDGTSSVLPLLSCFTLKPKQWRRRNSKYSADNATPPSESRLTRIGRGNTALAMCMCLCLCILCTHIIQQVVCFVVSRLWRLLLCCGTFRASFLIEADVPKREGSNKSCLRPKGVFVRAAGQKTTNV